MTLKVLVGVRKEADGAPSVCPWNLSVMDVSGGVLTRPLPR